MKIFDNDNNVSILDLWKKLTEFDADFPFKYAVYHKLRSKGWILKNGIKYGCDFSKYLFINYFFLNSNILIIFSLFINIIRR